VGINIRDLVSKVMAGTFLPIEKSPVYEKKLASQS
jgi:hypothetical protein